MSSRRSAEAVRSPASCAPPSVEFQRQWQTGQKPRIETFLSQRPAMSVSEVAAVVRVDLRQRWRSGEQLGASDYLARFPQLLADTALVVDLIYTEFLVREELGERLHLSHLQRQFPQHADELAAQVEFHCALENTSLETSEEQPENDAETEHPHETLGPQAKPKTRLPSLGPGYQVLAEIGRGGIPREVVDEWQGHAGRRPTASDAYYRLRDEESQAFMFEKAPFGAANSPGSGDNQGGV